MFAKGHSSEQHRRTLLGRLLCCVTGYLVLTGGAASARTADSRSVLAGLQKLQKPVAYSETKIALGDLVNQVAEDTGTRISASKDAADEPVAVVVRDIPARELLEQLAELLDYRWSR